MGTEFGTSSNFSSLVLVAVESSRTVSFSRSGFDLHVPFAS